MRTGRGEEWELLVLKFPLHKDRLPILFDLEGITARAAWGFIHESQLSERLMMSSEILWYGMPPLGGQAWAAGHWLLLWTKLPQQTSHKDGIWTGKKKQENEEKEEEEEKEEGREEEEDEKEKEEEEKEEGKGKRKKKKQTHKQN
ncbi:hypothetical protein TREES_T100005097 [Tupaia chinensis]|uniref:Uncharacterized protein n=1 Tax=Tupaia chinensis TaxID=246437 RepID=L9L1L3_TUPCH|nr:hypothetical protein TREES_T100005097 [Tupaia chinensis]